MREWETTCDAEVRFAANPNNIGPGKGILHGRDSVTALFYRQRVLMKSQGERMDTKRTEIIVVVAVLMLAAVVIGEAAAYAFYPNHYSASSEWDGGAVEYSVSSNGSDGYTAVAMTGSVGINDLVIYIDESFDDNLDDARDVCQVLGFDQKDMSDQITKQLSIRGFESVSEKDSQELGDYVSSTLADASGRGILVVGYALPSSVYAGNPADPIFQWISNGGRLYWAASEIGRFYTDVSGVHEVSGNQELFFGTADCIYRGGDKATDIDGLGFCELLSIQNNRMEFAVSTSVPGILSLGYLHEGYASVSFMGMGAGSVCVFSGELPLREPEDIAQVIAAGITDETVIVNSVSGEVRGTDTGRIDGVCDSLYIYIGGVNTVFGRLFHA